MLRETIELVSGTPCNIDPIYHKPDEPDESKWNKQPKQKIFWPKAVDQKIMDVAMEHRKFQRDVQTLAFLCGYEDHEKKIIASHLVFPTQIEDKEHFEDKGKPIRPE